MKKLLLIFLVTLIVVSGAMAFVYQDQVKDMVLITKNAITALLGGEETPDEPDDDTDAKIVSIALDLTGAKTTFDFGEPFTTEGVKVIATLDNGKTKELSLEDCRVIPVDTHRHGVR